MTQQVSEVQTSAVNGAVSTETTPEATAEAPVAEATATEAVEVATGPFDLNALLLKIEQSASKVTNVRRQLVAYLGGLIDDAGYKKFRRELVKKHGVAETDMEAFDTYSGTEACSAAWLAFCDYSYNTEGTTADVCKRKSVV